jgi:hypothetical protein
MAAMFVNRTEQDEISNLYRGLSIDASYQVSVQLAKQFQGRRFLEIDQSETRIACGGQHTHTHSFHSSTKFSHFVHLLLLILMITNK